MTPCSYQALQIPSQPTVTAERLSGAFDLIVLSCKAYDLAGAMGAFAPAVGRETAILPLLNGMGHLDALETRFGGQHVLGGQCLISTTLDAEGRILHLNDTHSLAFGERDGSRSRRVAGNLRQPDGFGRARDAGFLFTKGGGPS